MCCVLFMIEDRESCIEDRESDIEDRESCIEDRESCIEDRESAIDPRGSKIAFRYRILSTLAFHKLWWPTKTLAKRYA